jgi:predicted nucleic acid-binding protein
MNRQAQAQEQEDFEFCTCDVCMRELRRAAEKEALEAAAKQQLMVRLFNSICSVPFPSSFNSLELSPQMGRTLGNGSKT